MREGLKRVVGLLLAMAIVGPGFVVLLSALAFANGAGSASLYRWTELAGVIAIAAGLGLVIHIRSHGGRKLPLIAKRRRPRGSRPAPPTEAQAAYAADPAQLATCPHLQPIERDMRVEGIPVSILWGTAVSAGCRIDKMALQDRYGLTMPVFYDDSIPGDRPGEPDGAAIICREHRSSIVVVHRDWAGTETPIFPGRAG